MSNYKITGSIPLPDRKSKNYPFHTMLIGESIEIPSTDSFSSAASIAYGIAQYTQKKFAARSSLRRIWRTK